MSGDPLDEPSGTFIEIKGKDGKPTIKELTFRELHDYCADGMKLLDSLRPDERFAVQRHNDKNWTPIGAWEGLRKHKRRRF